MTDEQRAVEMVVQRVGCLVSTMAVSTDCYLADYWDVSSAESTAGKTDAWLAGCWADWMADSRVLTMVVLTAA